MAYILMNSGFSSQSKWKSWAEATDEELAEMLRLHYEGTIDIHDFWNIGDERTIELSSIGAIGDYRAQPQQTVTLVLVDKGIYKTNDGHDEQYTIYNGAYTNQPCAFVVGQKEPLIDYQYYGRLIDESTSPSHHQTHRWDQTDLRRWLGTYNGVTGGADWSNTYEKMLPESFRILLKRCIHNFSYTEFIPSLSSFVLNTSSTNGTIGGDTIFIPQIYEFGLDTDDFIRSEESSSYHTMEYYLKEEHRYRYINEKPVTYWTGTQIMIKPSGSTRYSDYQYLFTVDQNNRTNVSLPNANNVYMVPHMFI